MPDDPGYQSPRSENSQALQPAAAANEMSDAGSKADEPEKNEGEEEGEDEEEDPVSPGRSESFSQRKIRARLEAHSSSSRISARRIVYGECLYHRVTEIFIGLTTILNFAVILIDADMNAHGQKSSSSIVIINTICLFIYSFEMCIRFFVERCNMFRESLNWLDIIVVSTGYVSTFFEIAELADPGNSIGAQVPLGPLRTLRCLRLLRLVKALVLIKQLKELRRLLQGIGSCVRILFWALILVCLFTTIWGTMAVELLNPLMEEIALHTPEWEGCSRCPHAFASVLAANLTLFQTIIGGDSWGLVAIPVIESYPFAAILFVGSLFSIQVGVLSLVVAVLCDASAEARLKDTEARFAEAAEEEISEKKKLARIFKLVDVDGSGALDYDELALGALEVEEFKQTLDVMDIKGDDLYQLFLMLDDDGSGELDPEEFIEALYRLKCGDNQTAATFVKHYVVHLFKTMSDMSERLQTLEGGLLDSISSQIAGMHLGTANEDLEAVEDGTTVAAEGEETEGDAPAGLSPRQRFVEQLRQISKTSSSGKSDAAVEDKRESLRKSLGELATTAGQSGGAAPPALRRSLSHFALAAGSNARSSPKHRVVEMLRQVTASSHRPSQEGLDQRRPSLSQAVPGPSFQFPATQQPAPLGSTLTQEQFVRMMSQLVLCPVEEETGDLSAELRTKIEGQLQEGRHRYRQVTERWSTLETDLDYGITAALTHVLSSFQSFSQSDEPKGVQDLIATFQKDVPDKCFSRLSDTKGSQDALEKTSSQSSDPSGEHDEQDPCLNSSHTQVHANDVISLAAPNGIAPTGKSDTKKAGLLSLQAPNAVAPKFRFANEGDACLPAQDSGFPAPAPAAVAYKGKASSKGVPAKLAEAIAAQQAKSKLKADAKAKAEAEESAEATEKPDISLEDGLSELPPASPLLLSNGVCSSRPSDEGLTCL